MTSNLRRFGSSATDLERETWWRLYSQHGVAIKDVADRFNVSIGAVRKEVCRRRAALSLNSKVNSLPRLWSSAVVQPLCHLSKLNSVNED